MKGQALKLVYEPLLLLVYEAFSHLALEELEQQGSRLYFQCRKRPEHVGDVQRVKLS